MIKGNCSSETKFKLCIRRLSFERKEGVDRWLLELSFPLVLGYHSFPSHLNVVENYVFPCNRFSSSVCGQSNKYVYALIIRNYLVFYPQAKKKWHSNEMTWLQTVFCIYLFCVCGCKCMYTLVLFPPVGPSNQSQVVKVVNKAL